MARDALIALCSDESLSGIERLNSFLNGPALGKDDCRVVYESFLTTIEKADNSGKDWLDNSYHLFNFLSGNPKGGLGAGGAERLQAKINEMKESPWDPSQLELLSVFQPNPLNQVDRDRLTELAMQVAQDTSIPKNERYCTAYIFLARQFAEDGAWDTPREVQEVLFDLGLELFADPSELEVGLNANAGIEDAYYGSSIEILEDLAGSLGLNKNDSRLEVIRELKLHIPNDGSGTIRRLVGARRSSLDHRLCPVTFTDPEVGSIKVGWNVGYISKPLPTPKVPDVSNDDFLAWVDDFKREMKSSPEVLREMMAMTGAKSLKDFVEDIKYNRFKEFLDDGKVQGSFVDSTALSLRRVIAHANALSTEPEKGEKISPRSLLFQQLLYNCRTCVTGFAGGVDSTVNALPTVSEVEVDEQQQLDEDAMKQQRFIVSLKNEYGSESVKRRKKVLDGSSALVYDLTGVPVGTRMSEPMHQAWMVDALVGKQVGLHGDGDSFKVDPYWNSCVNKELLKTDPQVALDAFYQHYSVGKEVAYFKDLWNQQLAEDDILSKAKDNGERMHEVGHQINNKVLALVGGQDMEDVYEWDEDFNPIGFSDYGVALILTKMGVLDIVE